MIYRCSFCTRTSFETTCPWCASFSAARHIEQRPELHQVPLDPSFYPEFQYQAKGFLKDLLGKKKEQGQLNEKLSRVLRKYSELKKPYFANFVHTMAHAGTTSSEENSPGPRTDGNYTNRELFREVLIRKGFGELEEFPSLLDKLLFTTAFNADYLGFSSEVSRYRRGPLKQMLRSWIEEAGTRFRDNLSLFFYYLWSSNNCYGEIAYSTEASTAFGAPLVRWSTITDWLRICESIYFDVQVERLSTKLEHFDPSRFITMYHVDAMNGYEFEKFLAEIFQTIGYDVEGTKLSGDQGADLFATRFGKKVVIQAKNYSGSVGNSAVQEAISAKAFYACDEAMVVTNSYFTKSAIELATSAAVRLVGRADFQVYLDEYNQKIIERFRMEETVLSDPDVVANTKS